MVEGSWLSSRWVLKIYSGMLLLHVLPDHGRMTNIVAFVVMKNSSCHHVLSIIIVVKMVIIFISISSTIFASFVVVINPLAIIFATMLWLTYLA